jgi:lambda family phage minor tail protein L
MTIPQSIQEQLQAVEPSAIIELFQLELTAAINGTDQTFYYHAGTNDLVADIVFDGLTYTAYPIEADGFEMSSQGTLPRPTMRIANADNAISALLALYNPLKAKVTRIRTCKKFLDAVNFTGGTNATADPTAKFDDQIWYIDRVASENLVSVEFELTSKLDLTNLKLPRRKILEHCPWVYRGQMPQDETSIQQGGECGYRGTSFFDINDNPVASEADDVCGKRFRSCELRFGRKNDLPFGGFTGSRLQT